FLPYPHIVIYPVLPTPYDSIDEYGDWPLEMMLHEYTHILNMYPAHSFYVPLKWIFGSVVRPNALLPRWYLEGLAVNIESRFSDRGRLRSSETQAVARALIADEKLAGEDISTINESESGTWPYGARPYLYGGWWWEAVQREKGAPLIYTWNQNFSRRLPFWINGPMEEQTGRSAAGLLSSASQSLEARAQEELKKIRASGPHTATAIAESDEGEQFVFAISPSGGQLIYWVSRPKMGSQVRLKTRTRNAQSFAEIKAETLFKSVGTLRARWVDEDRFMFDMLDITRPHITYRDLYMYDLKTREPIRLTEGARAQEPSPSPDGRRVAFIQNEGGRNSLAILRMDDRRIRTVVRGNFHQRLSSPEFLDDTHVAFVARGRNGSERIYVHDIRTGKSRLHPTKLEAVQTVRHTPDGLLVTDASRRVRNAYLVRPGHPPQAVSNTLTDIQAVDYDPQRKDVLVSELTGRGRRLHALGLRGYQPPALNNIDLESPPRPATRLDSISLKEESYQPLAYMWPRYWIPFIYQVEGGWILQGLTGSRDPAGRNHYSLMGAFDTVTNKASYGVNYLNSSLPTDISLDYAKTQSYLGASGLTIESDSAGLGLSSHWPFGSRNTKWGLGGVWMQTTSATTFRRLGPEASLVYSRLQSPLNGAFGWHLEGRHRQFLEQDGYLAYGHSYLHTAGLGNLGGGHRLFGQARGALAPDLPLARSIDLGDRNVGGNYLISLANSSFLLRGYPSGSFVGRRVVNGNLEYVLPARELGRGFGTFPLFLRGFEIALFGDAMAVDGAGFDLDRELYIRSHLSEWYLGSGAEMRLNTTIAYHLPLSLTLGLYYGFNERFGGGFSPFLGVGVGDLQGIENKTP
ncbi:MAG: hypothetical protein AB7P49_18180, partial [Bdellovibrionales bacterium]